MNDRKISYYRQRFRQKVFNRVVGFLTEEAERHGTTRKSIAGFLGKDPSQISRSLSAPSNLTLDTISDLLLAAGAEMETPIITRFSDKKKRNYAHPLIDRINSAVQTTANNTIRFEIQPRPFLERQVDLGNKTDNSLISISI
jgi:transcriptional regulator with XRE-family HTH domain